MYFPRLFLALLAVSSVSFGQAIVRISGSRTVYNLFVKNRQDTVMKSTVTSLIVSPENSGRGFSTLLKGDTDIAMSSEPLAMLVDQVKVDAADFREIFLGNNTIVFVVNDNNPIRPLKGDQYCDILAGKVTNWSQVGGADLPITVVSEEATGGSFAIVRQKLMNGRPMGPKTIYVPNIVFVARNVGELEGAVGFCPEAMVNGNVRVMLDFGIPQPLYLIVRKNASQLVTTVAEAFVPKR